MFAVKGPLFGEAFVLGYWVIRSASLSLFQFDNELCV